MKKNKTVISHRLKNAISMVLFTIVYTVVVIFYFFMIIHDFTICVIITGVFYPYALNGFRHFLIMNKMKNIELQFGEALKFISSSLSAGATIDNSFYDFVANADAFSRTDLADIVNEFRIITNSMDMHESITTAFGKFAERSGSSDIKIFSLAFSQVCLSGGDMISLIRNTSASLRIKRETEDEIDLILSGPKYNHRVITVMPVLIIFLMNFISPEYVQSVYTGPGKIVSVISAVLIGLAFLIGSKIADIKF